MRSLVAALLVGLIVIVPALSSAQSQWTLEAGGGATTPYTYHTYQYSFGTYSERFDASWNAFLNAGRRIGPYLAVQSQIGYGQFQDPIPVATAADGASGGIESRLHARFVSLGIGLRASRGVADVRRPRPYAQLLPTLYISNWREHTEYQQTYRQAARTEEHSSTWVLPGFEAGVGLVGPLHGPLKLDVGFRYKYSADPGQKMLGQFSGGDFDGLRQVDFVAAIVWSK